MLGMAYKDHLKLAGSTFAAATPALLGVHYLADPMLRVMGDLRNAAMWAGVGIEGTILLATAFVPRLKESRSRIFFAAVVANTTAMIAVEYAKHPNLIRPDGILESIGALAVPCVLTAAALGLGTLSLKIRSEEKAKANESFVEKIMKKLSKQNEHRVAAIAQGLDVTTGGQLATPEVIQALDHINSGTSRDAFEVTAAVRQRLNMGEKLTPGLVVQVKHTLKIQKGR